MFATRMLFLQCTLLLIIYFYGNHCFRLPTSIVPMNYDVKLIVFLDEGMGKYDFSYKGSVGIKVKCVNATKKVILNLVPDLVKLDTLKITKQGDNRKVLASRFVGISDDELLQIDLEKNLVPSEEYYIYTEFSAPLNLSLWGFYSTYYINENGKKKWAAVTVLQPYGIRRMFPTFDEPRFKATFTTSIGHHKRFKALFNMPLESSEPLKEVNNGKDWVLDKFKVTPKMATYIFCVFVGDFSFTTPLKKNNEFNIKVWSRPEVVSGTKILAENTENILEMFIDYFQNDYPMPKTDLISIPDYNQGAMECWGLITMQEENVLNVDTTNSNSEQYAVLLLSHELAHQWFGNLVTPKDWSETWLNEGFATYFSNIIVNKIYPNLNKLEENVKEEIFAFFDEDQYESSFGLSEPLADVRSVSERFTTISYNKGSVIIRMMNHLLGEETFYKGIKDYLKKYAYSSVTRFDLFNTLNAYVEKGKLPTDFTSIMNTWCIQAGYPLVHVKKIKEGGEVKLQISQERFYLLPPGSKKKNECWWIPLTYTTTKELNFQNTTPKLWLSCSKRVLTIKHPDPSASVIFNLGLSGLYKVNYDSETWESLISILLDKEKYKKIDILSRVLLVENAFSLAAAGIISYDIPFKLYPYTIYDVDEGASDAAIRALGYVLLYLKGTPLNSVLMRYLTSSFLSKYKDGRKSESVKFSNKMESLILPNPLLAKSEYWKRGTKKLFRKWMENSNNTRRAFSNDCAAIQKGDEKKWNSVWQKYKSTVQQSQQISLLHSLACTKKKWLLSRYLEWVFVENSEIRFHNSASVFNAILSNEDGYCIAKSFLFNNIARIYKLSNVKRDTMGEYVVSLALQINRKVDQKTFKKFLEKNAHYFTYSKLKVKKALEIMEVNINWLEKHYKKLKNILQKDNLRN